MEIRKMSTILLDCCKCFIMMFLSKSDNYFITIKCNLIIISRYLILKSPVLVELVNQSKLPILQYRVLLCTKVITYS